MRRRRHDGLPHHQAVGQAPTIAKDAIKAGKLEGYKYVVLGQFRRWEIITIINRIDNLRRCFLPTRPTLPTQQSSTSACQPSSAAISTPLQKKLISTMASPISYTSKLDGSRILILGGTSGVGFGVASAALQFGADVIISGSNPERLTRSLDRLRTQYPDLPPSRISGKTCDLGDAAALETNLDELLRFATTTPEGDTKKINHAVLTAGDALNLTPLSETTPASIAAASQVRFYGAVILAKLLPKYAETSPETSLTFTGGVNTNRPLPGWAVMAAVGAAVEGLTRGLAVDLKPMRVNTVSLGAVKTELLDGYLNSEGGEEKLEAFRRGSLTGRLGRVEDVVEAYLYMMRDGFVTGEVLKTHGGRLLV